MRPRTGPPRTEARQIIATGPEWGVNKTGTATPIWQVWAADADRNPVSRVYKCYNYWKTKILAATMATDRKLPLVEEFKDDPNPDPARVARRAYLLSALTAAWAGTGVQRTP